MSGRTRRLSELVRGAGLPTQAPGTPDPEIRRVVLDSRATGPGSLFVALRGLEADGNDFVPGAIERGAVAILSESSRPNGVDPAVAWIVVPDARSAVARLAREHHDRPDEAVAVAGVTGTDGKTTVTYMIEAIATAAGRSAGRIGTNGYSHGGVERQTRHTTPEATELYGMLSEMREAAVDVVAMEVSSHALSLGRVDGMHFRVGAFLNLKRDHLDFHIDAEAYFRSKARLIERLSPDAHAVIGIDDASAGRLLEAAPANLLTFGRSERADVRIVDEHHGIDGASAVLETPAGRLPIRTFLIGRFNTENVAAAAACALALGLPPESIPAGILALESVPGRVERIDLGQPFTVVVDYAHTEDALSHLLSAVRGLVEGRLLVVFGCGGNRDRGKRRGMGRLAATIADRVHLTSDNPRDEDPMAILHAIEEGVREVSDGPARTTLNPDRPAAIRAALLEARPGDAVVIAGKGHETTQTIAGRTLVLDDRETARTVLRELGWQGERHANA